MDNGPQNMAVLRHMALNLVLRNVRKAHLQRNSDTQRALLSR